MTTPAPLHTPGPWNVEKIGPAPRCLIHASRDVLDDRPIAMTYGQPSQEADATLIAAAPDMLAALRDLLGTVERGDPIGPAKRAAVAAIAKAEGRS